MSNIYWIYNSSHFYFLCLLLLRSDSLIYRIHIYDIHFDNYGDYQILSKKCFVV